MSIIVIHNKRSAINLKFKNEQVCDLGRSSKTYQHLSNDYTHLPLKNTRAKYQVSSVQEAVQNYEIDLRNKLKLKNQDTKRYMSLLYSNFINCKLNNKFLYLACWCKDELQPQPQDHECHCDVIRNILLEKYAIDYTTFRIPLTHDHNYFLNTLDLYNNNFGSAVFVKNGLHYPSHLVYNALLHYSRKHNIECNICH